MVEKGSKKAEAMDTSTSKDAEETVSEAVDVEAVTLGRLREQIRLLEMGESAKDPSYVNRVLRQLLSTRKALSDAVLGRLVNAVLPNSPHLASFTALLNKGDLPNKETMDGDRKAELKSSRSAAQLKKAAAAPGAESKSTGQGEVGLEVELYIHLLFVVFLLDRKRLAEADACVQALVERVESEGKGRRSLSALASRVFYYHALVQERLGRLAALQPWLNERLTLATLGREEEVEAVLINVLLRSYLTQHLYEPALKLVAKVRFPETAGSNEWSRHLYYLGTMKTMGCDYADAHKCLKEALAKAPKDTALGFKQRVTKALVVVELLEAASFPERSIFRQKEMRLPLAPYLRLTSAVRVGDVKEFDETIADHKAQFARGPSRTSDVLRPVLSGPPSSIYARANITEGRLSPTASLPERLEDGSGMPAAVEDSSSAEFPESEYHLPAFLFREDVGGPQQSLPDPESTLPQPSAPDEAITSRSFNIAACNGNGWRSKKPFVETALHLHSLDVLVFLESKLDEKVDPLDVSVPGYQLLHRLRNQNGGGVTIAIGDAVEAKVITQTAGTGLPGTLEALSVLLKGAGLPRDGVVVTGVYLTPKKGPSDAVPELLDHLTRSIDLARRPLPHFIIGDYNTDLLTDAADELLAAFGSIGFNLISTPGEPTYRRPGAKESQLDWGVANVAGHALLLGPEIRLPPLERSSWGHAMLAWPLKASSPLPTTLKKTSFRNWKQFDASLARHLAMHHGPDPGAPPFPFEARVDLGGGPDDVLGGIVRAVTHVIDKTVPVVTVRKDRRRRPAWLTGEIARLAKAYAESYRSLAPHVAENPSALAQLKRLAKRKRAAVRTAKRKYAHSIVTHAKGTGTMFSVHRTLLGNQARRQIPTLALPNGREAKSDEAKAAALAATFQGNYGRPEGDDELPHLPHEPTPDYEVPNVKDTVKLLRRLRPKKAAGRDSISPMVWKELAVEVAPAVRVLLEKVLLAQVVPSSLLHSWVAPVPKCARPKKPEDNRAVFILDSIGKVVDAFVARKLYSHIAERLPIRSFAYQKKAGCVDAVCHLQLRVFEAAKACGARKIRVAVLLLDARRAFESLKHSAIVGALKAADTPAWLARLLLSFLRGRSAEVRVGDAVSARFQTPTGVPAGTAVAGHLFGLTLASLDSVPVDPDTNVQSYADDIALSRRLSTAEDEAALRRDAQSVADYLTTLGLALNVAKSQLLLIEFGNFKPLAPPLLVNGSPVEEVAQAKYLGIGLDKRLSFQGHNLRLASAARAAGGVMSRLVQGSRTGLEWLYRERIESVIRWSVLAAPPSTNTAWQRLCGATSRTAHLITNNYLTHGAEVIKLAGLVSPPILAATTALGYIYDCVFKGRRFGKWLRSPEEPARLTRSATVPLHLLLDPPVTRLFSLDTLQPIRAQLLWNAVIKTLHWAGKIDQATTSKRAFVAAAVDILPRLRPKDIGLYHLYGFI